MDKREKVMKVLSILVVVHIDKQYIDIIIVLLVTTDMAPVVVHLADMYVRVLHGILLFLSMVVAITMLITIIHM